MKDPVDHILRPQLPWRDDGGVTECGYDATKVPTLSRVEYFARLKDFGQQRSAVVTCMTCANTAARWGTWADDPRKALEREIQWEAGWRKDRGEQLRDELDAMAEIVSAHREEFDALVSHRQQQRAWNEKKAAVARKPVAPIIRGGL